MAKRDFLTITDFSSDEYARLLPLALRLKRDPLAAKPFGGGAAALVFLKPSLRTRASFDVGVHQLGGHPLYITDQEIGLGKRESVADIARVLSRFVDLIMIRAFAHSDVEELARYASVPVVNGLTDSYHPCQIVADILTITEQKGSMDGLTVTYLGDGNNVAHSWLRATERFPFNLRIGTVPENDPDPDIVAHAKQDATGDVEIIRDPHAAVDGADVLYTDVWASMGQKDRAAENRQRLAAFQLNEDLLARARPDALVLHCLPANRGEEITDAVMDGPHSRVFDQAENRLHAQKAIMHALLAGL